MFGSDWDRVGERMETIMTRVLFKVLLQHSPCETDGNDCKKNCQNGRPWGSNSRAYPLESQVRDLTAWTPRAGTIFLSSHKYVLKLTTYIMLLSLTEDNFQKRRHLHQYLFQVFICTSQL